MGLSIPNMIRFAVLFCLCYRPNEDKLLVLRFKDIKVPVDRNKRLNHDKNTKFLLNSGKTTSVENRIAGSPSLDFGRDLKISLKRKREIDMGTPSYISW